MTTRTRVQNRTVSGAGVVPLVSTVAPGEIVINTTTGQAWTSDGSTLVEINGGVTAVQPTVEGEVFKVRGQAGDYQLSIDDDYTLIVCVTGATITIPEGVPFPAGFRVWLRQDHATDYVYVESGGAINVTSYQGFTGTAGQYATIELINIAGSNWLLRGEGAVKSAPAAPSVYIPNKGIAFSSGNYFSNLNLNGLVADSKKFSFRAFVKLAQLTQVPVTGFTVFEDLLSVNRPSGQQFLDNWGIHGENTLTWSGSEIWANYPTGKPAWGAADPFTEVPLRAEIEALATSHKNSGKEWAVLDLEQYPISIYDSVAELDRSILRFIEIVQWYKAILDPGQKVAYYSAVPARLYDHQNSVPGSSLWNAMETFHDRWSGLVNEVDALLPSGYYIRDNPAGMATMIQSQIIEGQRLSAARAGGPIPTYNFLWPQYNLKAQNPELHEAYLPGNIWRQLMDAVIDGGGDGFYIWGLYYLYYPPGADNTYCNWENAILQDWWAETVDFMATRVATQ